MEEKIERTASRIKMSFIHFRLLSAFLVVFGETGRAWVGFYAGGVHAAYFAEAITILPTALSVPIPLKLFSRMLVKGINTVSISDALRLYVLRSGVRLVLPAVPVVAGFLIYYMVLSNKEAPYTLIALTASLFCLPGEERLRRELHVDKG